MLQKKSNRHTLDNQKCIGHLSRALHLFALVQIVIAYPIYELLSRNAEFFVARQAQAIDIGLVVAALSFFLPFSLFSLQWLLSKISARLGLGSHLLMVAILFLLLGLSIFQNMSGQHIPGTTTQLFASVVFCFLLTGIYWKTTIGSLFVSFLSPAILLVPLIFLFNSEIAALMESPETSGAIQTASNPATIPIVFVILDELPTYALLTRNGQLDASRFPNFSALAETSNWYRNATSVSTSTVLAIPAIVNGLYPTRFAMPHTGEFPDNLFTWLGGDYEMNVRESVSVLCPANLCSSKSPPPVNQRLHSFLMDISAIYLSMVAPDFLQKEIPVVTQSWEGFWNDAKPESRLYEHRLQQMRDFTQSIRSSSRPGLNFMHANFPHVPYEYLPSGKRYQEGWLMPGLDFANNMWVGTDQQSVQMYRRFLLQLGAVDMWLGELMKHLKSEGLFDQSLIIITADHGVSFTPGSSRRDVPPDNNMDENIMPVPLFIKAPYQTEGLISQQNAESIDIMPTVAELIGRPLSWEVDGVSLFGSLKDERKFAVHSYKEMVPYHSSVADVASYMRPDFLNQRFPDSETFNGRYPNLIGQSVSALSVRPGNEMTISIDHASYYDEINLDSGFLPAHVNGSIQWTGKSNVDIAIALNGEIVAVTTSYDFPGDRRFSAIVPESAFRNGENDIQVFGIESANTSGITLVASNSNDLEEQYHLDKVLQHVILAGTPLPLDTQGIKGELTYISFGEDAAEIFGWTIDSANSVVVKSVLVFDGQTLVYSGGTHMLRGQTHQFGVSVNVGFLAVIPFSLIPDRNMSRLKVFAITADDRTVQLNLK